ncbi:MAG: hypothetical protein R3Y15_06865 [Rikenellaceae bacterium]
MYSNIKNLTQLRQVIVELNSQIKSQQKVIKKSYQSSTKMFSISYVIQQIYHKSQQIGTLATAIKNGIISFKSILKS